MDGTQHRLSRSFFCRVRDIPRFALLLLSLPYTSLTHDPAYVEGLNARLPNQDLINSFTLISGWVSGVSATLYDYPERSSSRALEILRAALELAGVGKKWGEDYRVKEYVKRARNVWNHAVWMVNGKGSGAHGVFHRCVSFSFLKQVKVREARKREA
jgi:GPI-anchor transamidase subunit GAA1